MSISPRTSQETPTGSINFEDLPTVDVTAEADLVYHQLCPADTFGEAMGNLSMLMEHTLPSLSIRINFSQLTTVVRTWLSDVRRECPRLVC